MLTISGKLMNRDVPIATIEDGRLVWTEDSLLPLYLKRTGNLEQWLADRAIDSHRVNSRLLKKALRLHSADDVQTTLSVNAATITDNYWFRPEGSQLTYADIRFHENYFDGLALRGDPDGFSQKPSRTPELTNIGSYEKCWRLKDGVWWMYKSGTQEEYFSELFIAQLGARLGFSMAEYEMDGDYIRTRDFTHGASVNFETADGIVGEDDDYSHCFSILYALSPALAEEYLKIIWMDTLCFNMDRHTKNFGVLRDVKSGEILGMAPNYDNNVALISRGYSKDVTRSRDGLIRFYQEFLEQSPAAASMLHRMELPKATSEIIRDCFQAVPVQTDETYLQQFLLNGQQRMEEILEAQSQMQDKLQKNFEQPFGHDVQAGRRENDGLPKNLG